MKILIASDIHGSSYYAEKLYEIYEQSNPDYVFLLGDYLYHGPQNDLPREYNVQKTITILNKMKSKIIGLKGDCDSEADLKKLLFDIDYGFRLLNVDGIKIYLTHGHINNILPKIDHDSILITGNTHIYNMEEKYINPGSISLPLDDAPHTYIMYNDHKFYLYDIDKKKLLKKLTIKNITTDRKYINPYS